MRAKTRHHFALDKHQVHAKNLYACGTKTIPTYEAIPSIPS